jgi:hypothetical protein
VKVKELIEKLNELPQEMEVVARGYESDWSRIDEAGELIVWTDPQHAWRDGEFTDFENGTEGITVVRLY